VEQVWTSMYSLENWLTEQFFTVQCPKQRDFTVRAESKLNQSMISTI